MKIRQVAIEDFGEPEVLQVVEVEAPSPGPGQLIVAPRYAGVSFTDIYMRKGYYRPPHTYATRLPFTPGVDGVGVVAAVGPGVDGWKEGDSVAYVLGKGGYSQRVAIDAWKAVRPDPRLDPRTLCGLLTNGLTAYYLSHVLRPVEPGDWCLVHAAAGSVGQFLTQLILVRGGRVIATAGSAEKERRLRELGVEHVCRYRERSFVEAVRDLTGGEGAHVAYDSVGADTYRDSMKALRRRGLCVLFGAASGIPDCVRPMEDLAENGSIFVTRPHFAHYYTDSEAIAAGLARLTALHLDGRLTVALHPERFGLDRAADAHRLVESRQAAGKVVLEIA